MRITCCEALRLSLVLLLGQAFAAGGFRNNSSKTESEGSLGSDLKMIVRVYNYAGVDPTTLALAENQALKILQHAGVTAEWRNFSLSSAATMRTASLSPDGPAAGFPDIFLRIVPSSMSPIDGRETLGCALPSSKGRPASDAWVLFDRIEREARLGIASPGQILGHAMAHEIGHLLLGPEAHTAVGVMRAHWGTQDYVLMSEGSLFFTPRQAQLLRLSVQARIGQERGPLKDNSPDLATMTPPTGNASPEFATTHASAAIEPGLRINVSVRSYVDVPRRTLVLAEEETSRIFRKAGVELAWVHCPTTHGEEERYPACQPPFDVGAVGLRILTSSMAARVRSSREEVGLAVRSAQAGSAADAWLFYERVERLAESEVASRDQILGYIIAHEIGHLLLGPDSHSPKGIMRANWDRKYLEEASRGQLLFTRDQARLIRAEVQARSALSQANVVR